MYIAIQLDVSHPNLVFTMATFFVLAKKYIHSSFNATVFAMATPLEWRDCTNLPHTCRELYLRKSYYRQAICLT